jgi:hypothetical protein
VGGACGTNGGEEELLWVFGREEITRKTKTEISE